MQYDHLLSDVTPAMEILEGLWVIVDENGRIVAWRSCMHGRTGWVDQTLGGAKRWWDVFDPVDPKKFSHNFFRQFVRDPVTVRHVTRWCSSDSNAVFLEWAFKRMPDPFGDGFVVMGIGQDISSHLAAQLNLARQNQVLVEKNKMLACRYRIAQLSVEPGLAFEDRLRQILETIPQAFGHAQAVSAHIELDGRSYKTDAFTPGPKRLMKRVSIQGKRRGRVEVMYDDGKIDDAKGSLTFLPQEKRFLEAVARKLALVIERKEAREAEEVLKEQIKHADRLATIGQLAAGIAHELNNPLADILGFAQLVANSPDLPEQTYADSIKIVQSALYAREVIKKILFFSRQTHLKETTANVNALVRDWLGFIQPRCAQSNIALVLELDPDLPDIYGDPSQLNQVLVNLVVNAIHAMPGGGRLTIVTSADAEGINLVVKDTGTGISKEIIDKIFLPFFTTKEVDKGTGLGLSVVYGIVTEHGGTISVDSRQEEGSQFTIRLPFR
jgi:signal transduction histidine kinase